MPLCVAPASRLSRAGARAAGVRRSSRMPLKKEMIGQWELSTTERSKTCVVTMKNEAAPQG